MRCLSVLFLVGVIFSSSPAPTLGFVATPKLARSPTLSSVEKAPRIQIQSRAPPSSKATSTAIHALSPELLASFLPPAMGYIKSEWTVSYGYGFATAFSAISLLMKQQHPMISTLHAASLVFYGLRLNAFLFLRNRLSPRYQEINKKIEEKANKKYEEKAKKNSNGLSPRYKASISKTPVVLSCGLLYYGLYLPVLLTSKFISDAAAVKSSAGVGLTVLKALIGMQWFGFLLGAVGDLTKSYVKGSEKDGKFLVTSGVFSVLRHPNYTGEIIAWTSNFLCGALSAAYLLRRQFSLSTFGSLGLSLMGCAGMWFVLLGATSNLEKRQQDDYGEMEKYKEWVKNTWSGWKLPPKTDKAKEQDELPEITLNAEIEEDFGSGI